MKNILIEKPNIPLHGRALYNTKFVEDSDLTSKTVLDIGCGYGWFVYNTLFRDVKKIMGVDVSKKNIDIARKFIKDKRVDFFVASALDMPFDSSMFDTLTSWELIEHLPKNTENKMFSEANRVLKEGGYFYLSTQFAHLISTFLDPAWWLTGHRHYSKKKILSFVTANGFEVEDCFTCGSFWEVLHINNLYFSKWVLRRSPLWADYINKKRDTTFFKEDGITNLFVKLKKVS